MSELRPPPTTYFCNTDRDRWTEKLTCRYCNTTGNVQLSMADKLSWDVQVDGISEGFKAIALKYGSDFFCCSCGFPAAH